MTRRRCFVEEKTKEKRSSVQHTGKENMHHLGGSKVPTRSKARASFGERKAQRANFRTAYLGNPNPSGSSLELLLPFFAIARMMMLLFSGRRHNVHIVVKVVALWRLPASIFRGRRKPLLAFDVNDLDDESPLADATTRMVVDAERATRLWCPFCKESVEFQKRPSLFFSVGFRVCKVF